MNDSGAIQRPRRWDIPYSEEMMDADVDRVLSVPPFSELDPKRFRGQVTLDGIIKVHPANTYLDVSCFM